MTAPARLIRGLLALVLAAQASGCDAPAVPARPGVYPFALQTASGDRVLRWRAGSSIRIALAPGGAAAANLSPALDAGIAAWNDAALYDEYRLVRVGAAADADVVLVGSDALPPLDVSACPPAGPGLGVTTFCLAPDGRSLAPFPLQPGGGGQVRMLVTVLASAAADPAVARRLVAHELGHVLGIARHSPSPADLMAAAAPTDRPGPADRATVLALYHTPADVLP